MPDDLERLHDLLAGAEPRLNGPAFMVVPSERAVYAEGTMVPLLGVRVVETPPSVTSELRLPGSAPAHLEYMGTYLTLREYLPRDLVPADLDPFLQDYADQATRVSLIGAIVAINEISKRPGGFEQLAAAYRAPMDPDLRQRFDAAMRAATGGLGRLVVAPQPVLLALRWLIGRPPLSQPGAHTADPREIFSRAIAFCHAVGATLRDSDDERSTLSDEDRKKLMLAMMNIGSLGDYVDVYASIDRTVRLWRDYGPLAARRLGASAEELLRRVADVDPHDVLAVGFALFAHISEWKPEEPLLLKREIHPNAPTDVCERVLELVGQELDQAQQRLGDPVSEFDILALESHPVLIEPDGLLVLDRDLLWRRCTSGLYWFVHDGLKARDGEAARHQWTMAYAEMVESLAEDALRPLAPPVLGTAETTFYTEEDFKNAYGEIARCDCGIDFGEAVLLIEVVSGQLTVSSRVHGDLDKLEMDFDRLVLDKCRQLDSIALALIADEEPVTTIPRGARHPRIVPAVVVGGGFPLNPLSYSYIRARLADEGLLNHPLIAPLAVLDLGDVEVLEGLGERGHDPARVLIEWQASDIRELSMHNFLIRHGLLNEGSRPSRMQTTVDATFQEVVRRLGLPPGNDEAD